MSDGSMGGKFGMWTEQVEQAIADGKPRVVTVRNAGGGSDEHVGTISHEDTMSPGCFGISYTKKPGIFCPDNRWVLDFRKVDGPSAWRPVSSPGEPRPEDQPPSG